MLADEVGSLQRGHALQLDGRHAAMQADLGVAVMGADVVVRRQKGERVALDIDKGLAGDEILDEMVVADLVGEGSEEVALHTPLPGCVVADDHVVVA